MPGAVVTRVQMGAYWVDWWGTQPTQVEIDDRMNQPAAQLLAEAKADAKALFDELDAIFRLHRAEVGLMVDEITLLRARLRAQDAAIAAATNLADLKSRWATLAAAQPMPDRNDAQARTALRNRIDAQT